jgi:hypothetical protein
MNRIHLALAGGLAMLALAVLPLRAQPFERLVAPFPVFDEQGAPYAFPFLGGLNVPRPQLLDLDADGDRDLLVQEMTGRLMFFENTGTPDQAQFVWRTDHYAGLDVGEWARLADLDGDGDFDVLAEQPFGAVRYYRNTGTAQAAQFTLAEDSLRTTEGSILFTERQNTPALADLDCDGRPDLLAGFTSGTITFYAHDGLDLQGLPRFRFVSSEYQGIVIIGSSGKTGNPLHGANTMDVADLDADGDPELVWGDFFEPGLILFDNTGTCAEAVLLRNATGFPTNDPVQTSGFNAPYFGDLDGDADPDLLVGVLGGAFAATGTTANNLYHFRNDGGVWTRTTTRFLHGLDLGTESTATLGDLDGDGDLELLMGNALDPTGLQSARLYRFENRGTATQPAWHLVDPDFLGFRSGFNLTPVLVDLDADGDLDLIVGDFNGTLALFQNLGSPASPSFVLTETRYQNIDAGATATPTFGDLDGDGDLDLLVGESGGTLRFYRNTGTRQQAQFVQESTAFADIDVGQRSAPFLRDLDGDGDLDLLVGSDTGLALYDNVTTGPVPTFLRDETLALPARRLSTPVLADLDGDTDPDLLVGSLEGGLTYHRNDRIPVSVEASRLAHPTLSVYPHPVTTTATVGIGLSQATPVRLVLYDLLGRAVAVVYDGFLSVGDHRVTVALHNHPAGVYLLRLTAGLFTQARTVVYQP